MADFQNFRTSQPNTQDLVADYKKAFQSSEVSEYDPSTKQTFDSYFSSIYNDGHTFSNSNEVVPFGFTRDRREKVFPCEPRFESNQLRGGNLLTSHLSFCGDASFQFNRNVEIDRHEQYPNGQHADHYQTHELPLYPEQGSVATLGYSFMDRPMNNSDEVYSSTSVEVEPTSADTNDFSSRFYSYLSGSSSSTFDVKSSASSCPAPHSAGSNSSIDSETVIKPEFQDFLASRIVADDEYLKPFKTYPTSVEQTRSTQRIMLSHDGSPKENIKAEETEEVALNPAANSFFEAPETYSTSQTREDFKRPLEYRRSEKTALESKTKTNSMRSRNHRCPECHKVFKRPLSFKIHYSIHTGEREFKCNWVNCGKQFNVKSNMTRHQKVHLKRLARKK